MRVIKRERHEMGIMWCHRTETTLLPYLPVQSTDQRPLTCFNNEKCVTNNKSKKSLPVNQKKPCTERKNREKGRNDSTALHGIFLFVRTVGLIEISVFASSSRGSCISQLMNCMLSLHKLVPEERRGMLEHIRRGWLRGEDVKRKRYEKGIICSTYEVDKTKR